MLPRAASCCPGRPRAAESGPRVAESGLVLPTPACPSRTTGRPRAAKADGLVPPRPHVGGPGAQVGFVCRSAACRTSRPEPLVHHGSGAIVVPPKKLPLLFSAPCPVMVACPPLARIHHHPPPLRMPTPASCCCARRPQRMHPVLALQRPPSSGPCLPSSGPCLPPPCGPPPGHACLPAAALCRPVLAHSCARPLVPHHVIVGAAAKPFFRVPSASGFAGLARTEMLAWFTGTASGTEWHEGTFGGELARARKQRDVMPWRAA